MVRNAAHRKIDVYYVGWGEDWLLGTLGRGGATTIFEYSEAARARGIEHSPIELPLAATPYSSFESSQRGLPGFIHDALPDGWGLLLIDRLLKRQGIERPDAFDHLSYIGDNAMGALRFVPSDDTPEEHPDWTLRQLAEESQQIHQGSSRDILAQLARTGGSAHGARPKALVQYDPKSQRISTAPDAPGEPWLFKFPAPGEHKEVCAIEALYADLARSAGIHMPKTVHVDLGRKLAAFGVQRFDRVQGLRVPMHSMAGLLHIDFRIPGAASYGDWLAATRRLTHSQREVEIAFARVVFNVVFHNRDDHPKNFAWLLSRESRWEVSPAFDLTFSDGPRGQHHMDVEGYGDAIPRSALLTLAQKHGIESTDAHEVIDRVLKVVDALRSSAEPYPIRKATLVGWTRCVERCAAMLVRG